MLIAVVAGQPVMDTSNFALVLVNVTVAVPLQLASASVTAGLPSAVTSFAALSSALKVFAGVGDGDAVGGAVGDGLGAAAGPPQAASRIAAAAMPASTRIFPILLVGLNGLRPVAPFR